LAGFDLLGILGTYSLFGVWAALNDNR